MSAQSGFLNCFLKFIQGDQGEKLPNMGRAKPLSDRFTITMDERKAILSASSKRLNQDQKAPPQSEPDRQRGKPGRPRRQDAKRLTRSTRSKGTTSEIESESGSNGGGEESHPGSEERLSAAKSDLNDKDDECSSSDGSSSGRDKSGGDEGPSVGGEPPCAEGKRGRGRRSADLSKGKASTTTGSATDRDAAGESSVILNGEAGETVAKEADGGASPRLHKKKRGRKRKNDSSDDTTPVRKLSSRRAKQKTRISYAESGDEEDMPGLDDNSDSDDPVWVPDEKKGSSDEESNFSWSKYEKLHLKSKKSCSNSPVVSPSKLREKVKNAMEEKGVKQNPSDKTASVNSGVVIGNTSSAKGVVGTTESEVGVVGNSGGTKGIVGNSDIVKGVSNGEKSESVSKSTPVKPTASSNGHVKVKDSAKNPAASSTPPLKPHPVGKSDVLNPTMIVMPFQSGKFIAQMIELEEKEEPPIWRVDGKSLLQKYEPFRSPEGKLWYRNVSTYSGWGPKSSLQYQEIPVKFIRQNRVETIVEIIHSELKISEDKLCEKIMKEYDKHAYAYEVFVQTLVSQALDSNFLQEIIAENDEYFLNCVEEIQKVCEEKISKLIEVYQWPKKLTASLTTWPVMALSKGEPLPSTNCSVCYTNQSVSEVKMDGNPYKFLTLEYEPPSQESFKSKEFTVCNSCSDILTLFHKIVHFKYHTYENGVKMVSDMRTENPDKNNTDILHDILADGLRIKKEFQEISRKWAQADMKSRKAKEAEDKNINTVVK